MLVTLGILLLLATSQLAVAMVNWLATLLVTPRPLPRMDFSRGLPPRSRTLVVIPTMLASAENIDSLLEALEVRFLANRDAHLHFGLLTDFQDASAETLPGDESLLWLARKGIEDLNEKYGRAANPTEDGATGDTFFLFHRPRRWNPQERRVDGVRAKARKACGPQRAPARRRERPLRARDRRDRVTAGREVRDHARHRHAAAARLRAAVCRGDGASAEPCTVRAGGKRNGRGRVTEGYGILQPRVSISLPGANRSWYARLHGGDPGIDPYTRAVSDVYQDVFGEGSFIGKGIYDVDAFEQALDGRFPENRILSHDLLEGCYARSGLFTDVQLYEEYPSTYAADISRRHRWIRGDWQLAGWLLPLVPGPGNRRAEKSVVGAVAVEALRQPAAQSCPGGVDAAAAARMGRASARLAVDVAVIAILLLPAASAFILDLLRKPDEVLVRQHLAATASAAGRHAAQTALTLAFLPYEAAVNLDAIARTAWRMLVTQRRLLEWNPSAGDEPEPRGVDETNGRSELAASIRSMWIAPVIAAATAILLAAAAPAALADAAPILLLWFVSPGIAWWISRPLARRAARLTMEQTLFLRKLARRTWAFFETFVGPTTIGFHRTISRNIRS